MTAMVSGGKDAFEKSFMRSITSKFRGKFASFGLRQFVYQRLQSGRQFIGLRGYSRGKPFTDFVADCAAVNAVDLDIKHRNSRLLFAGSVSH